MNYLRCKDLIIMGNCLPRLWEKLPLALAKVPNIWHAEAKAF